MVVHGIPGRTKLENGDILSVDVGVTLDGFVADSAWTFPVGAISADAQRLLDTCKAALAAGIDKARIGNTVGDISEAVQSVTEAAGFSVIRSLVGHGVGTLDARRPPGAELRLRLQRPGAQGGHDDRDRSR